MELPEKYFDKDVNEIDNTSVISPSVQNDTGKDLLPKGEDENLQANNIKSSSALKPGVQQPIMTGNTKIVPNTGPVNNNNTFVNNTNNTNLEEKNIYQNNQNVQNPTEKVPFKQENAINSDQNNIEFLQKDIADLDSKIAELTKELKNRIKKPTLIKVQV